VKPPRRRALYALLVALTIPVGLLSRHVHGVPAWLAKDPGDVLYATMVFFLVGFLAPALSTLRAALSTVVFCFAIELSQLYRAPGIDAVRATVLGGLVLGHGFHATDLACYVLGALLGVAVERGIARAAR